MFGPGGYPPMQQHYVVHASGGHPVLWVLFFVLLALLVGIVSALVFHWLARRRMGTLRLAPAAAGPAADALAVVRMRYARGEIDRDQYLQTTTDLSGGGYPAAEPPPDAPAA